MAPFLTLFGQVKKATCDNNSTLKFFKKTGTVTSEVIGVTAGIAIVIVILFGIQITCIVLGVVYKDNCPAEKYIPIFLIVLGVVSIVDIGLFKLCDDEGKSPALITLFLFAWFIAGTVWVFRIYPPVYEGEKSELFRNQTLYEDEQSELFCNHTLYMFSFVLLLIAYSLAALLLLLLVCGAIFGCCEDD